MEMSVDNFVKDIGTLRVNFVSFFLTHKLILYRQ